MSSQFLGFDHLLWYVGNAKQAAHHYESLFGFVPVAYRGLETGYRATATHVVRHGNVVFAFACSLGGDSQEGKEVGNHVLKHGDGVKDVAFRVRDCRVVFNAAVKAGAKVVLSPREYHDENGSVTMATICTYGDTVHTLVQRDTYRGPFLPGFERVGNGNGDDGNNNIAWDFKFIDHVVGNQGPGEMESAANWYRDKLGFHRFWTVDDKTIHTEYSSLRSIVMADESLSVKMPINEPADGKRKSQIQEFVDFFGGPGVQHIALNTSDCVGTVERLAARGVHFLTVPDAYYDDLLPRLQKSGVRLTADWQQIRRFNILVDFDEQGNYLLQIFTKPLADRPTVFLEVIQRCGHQGFGAGNFKALFESIEREQAKRGNL